MAMQIRSAKPSDAKGIAKVHVASWQSAYRGLLPDRLLNNLSVERSERRWIARLAQAGNRILVLERDDQIKGFVIFGAGGGNGTDQDKVGEIYAIYLDPKVWGHGYGVTLCREALKVLSEQGFTSVTVWVLRGNSRAIKFYRKVGFRADGVTKVEVEPDGTQLHQMRYQQALETL